MAFLSKIKERLNKRRAAVAGACVVAVIAATGLGMAAQQISSAATARECSTNSIDYKDMHGGCGAASPSEFIADVKSNNPSDLQAIYNHYGLSSGDYGRFVSSARMGTVYKDGRVVVDGQTVATGAWSVGRHNFAGRSKVTIAGKTYYTSPTSVSFNSSSIPAMVMFDSKGKMEFAALTACGNPVTGHPETPTYACNTLKKSAVSGKENTYNFSTDASAGHGAKIVKVEYNFGDGSATVTKTNPGDVVTHTFTKSATVSVKVYVSLPGKQTIVVQSTGCSTKVTVTPPKPVTPVMSCDQLLLTPGKIDASGNTPYNMVAKATAQNATIQSYTFTFGDQTAPTTITSSANTEGVTHAYAPGTYTASVSVKMTADGKSQNVTSAKCVGQITVKPLECKPGVPVGSPECQPTPAMSCDQLLLSAAGSADANGNVAYKLSASASAQNATIQSYTFTFGDQTPPATVTSSANTASVTHTYAPGTYTANVAVTMLANDKTQTVTSAKCVGQVTVGQVPMCTVPGKETLPANSPQCKEETCTSPTGQTYPVGSPQCETCTSVSGQVYPKGSAQCETCTSPSGQVYAKGASECQPVTPQVLAATTELPNTGPGQVVGIFVGASIVGAVAHRLFLRRRLSASHKQ